MNFYKHAAIAGLVLAPLVLSPTAFAAETLSLDSRDPGNAVFGQTVTQSASLNPGDAYVVTVSGTASIWGPGMYARGTCGVAEASPITPSPGAPATPAGWDANTIFAAPNLARVQPFGDACVNFALPANVPTATYAGFQMANGTAGAFSRPDPVGGARTVPRTDHTYNYQVVAQGGPIRFRFADKPSNDNSGVFAITVRTQAECAAVNCLGNSQVQSDQVTPPTVPAAPSSIFVAGVRACSLDKVLSVRVSGSMSKSIRKAVYFLNGKKLRTVKGRAIYIRKSKVARAQKFRNLPSGTLKLQVTVTTKSGQKATVKKTIERCSPRIKARSVDVKF